MEPHDDRTRQRTEATHDRFAAVVAALAADDPRFVRRVTRRAPGGLGSAELAIVVGVLATVVLGVAPLVAGLHTGVLALLVVGAAGCSLLPVAAPLAVRALARRRWPAAM